MFSGISELCVKCEQAVSSEVKQTLWFQGSPQGGLFFIWADRGCVCMEWIFTIGAGSKTESYFPVLLLLYRLLRYFHQNVDACFL